MRHLGSLLVLSASLIIAGCVQTGMPTGNGTSVTASPGGGNSPVGTAAATTSGAGTGAGGGTSSGSPLNGAKGGNGGGAGAASAH